MLLGLYGGNFPDNTPPVNFLSVFLSFTFITACCYSGSLKISEKQRIRAKLSKNKISNKPTYFNVGPSQRRRKVKKKNVFFNEISKSLKRGARKKTDVFKNKKY
jgi:hypothetical protein